MSELWLYISAAIAGVLYLALLTFLMIRAAKHRERAATVAWLRGQPVRGHQALGSAPEPCHHLHDVARRIAVGEHRLQDLAAKDRKSRLPR